LGLYRLLKYSPAGAGSYGEDMQADLKKVRRSAIIGSILLAIIGTLHLLKGHAKFYIFLYTLSGFLFIVGGFFPHLFKRITDAVGRFITALLLSIIYFILVTPMGLIMRLLGKDPLGKRIDRSRNSYWEDKEEAISSYENQY